MEPIESKKKVLLADDDADDRILFESAYQDRDDIILLPSVVSGEAVIDSLTRSQEDGLPDLIILDQNMPLMNGKQTLCALKSDDRFAKIAVCLYSTYADNQLVTECFKLGAYKVANKPITNGEYQAMMNEFLSMFLK